VEEAAIGETKLVMYDADLPSSIPPFPVSFRASGLLMHVTSLPSRYGIGDIGPAAHAWIDRIHDAGQSWWQALPVGPTGYGDSPYQALSSFAGNGLLISPDALIEDGLLSASDCAGAFPAAEVDYNAVIAFKQRGLLASVWSGFNAGARPDLRQPLGEFCHENRGWLDDYALFRAIKISNNNAYYLEWPSELIRREPAALARARRDHADLIDAIRLAQFLLFRQLRQLKEHANAKGVRIIGDIPFFVSPDSSDVWCNPDLFQLDENYRPMFVAGVPGDYFCPQGQLWGNPVYDWEALRETGYRWWIDRVRAVLSYVDTVRLDHFRAFAAAWHVPIGAATAQHGNWMPGPGADFFNAVQEEFHGLPFIVEDLGLITADVVALREQFHLPGNRILQFGFDGSSENPHLPHNSPQNAVVYTGTHDNPTIRQWYETLSDQQRGSVWKYMKRSPGASDEIAWEMTRLAWNSPAALAIVPLQDLLGLGSEGRMNRPGSVGGNWRWRCTEEMLAEVPWGQLSELTQASNRLSTDAAVSGTR
jgi:4-alpha-glucanotransferase